MKEKQTNNNDELIEAIRDLSRIFLATQGESMNKSEIIRKLDQLSIPPGRIAKLLGMQVKDVTSALYKSKKSKEKGKGLAGTNADSISVSDNQD